MINLKNITVQFDKKVVFRRFDFHAAQGEKVLLSAPSGKGKTCLVNLMLGFLQPRAGRIEIAGQVLSRHTVAAIRKHICYVGQEASLQSGVVSDVLAQIGGYKVNRHKDFSRARILALLFQFGLEAATMDKKVEMLSGGERQRLAFIVGIMLDRDIWLLDEITAGLDAERKEQVMAYVLSTDKTVVVISHDADWKEYRELREVVW